MADDKLKSAWNGADETEDLFEQFMPDDGFKSRTRRREPEVQISEVEKEVIVYVAPDNAIMPADEENFTYKRVVITPTGLMMPDDMTFEEWRDVGAVLTHMESAISWAVADWALMAANRVDYWLPADPDVDLSKVEFDTKYEQLLLLTNYSYQTLRDYAWIADSVPVSIRNRHVSFSHHRLVAKYAGDTDKQWDWLIKAQRNQWSVSQMQTAMNAALKSGPGTGNTEYVELFDRKHKPKSIDALQKLADDAIGRGDKKARKELRAQIREWKNWLKELESHTRQNKEQGGENETD